MILAPRWALAAQAIDAVGDSHLSPGIHVRVTSSDRLGLPVLPLAVYRVALGQGIKNNPNQQISWVDSHGTVLTPPFQVSAENPVTGWLPSPAATPCCWIAVDIATKFSLSHAAQLAGPSVAALLGKGVLAPTAKLAPSVFAPPVTVQVAKTPVAAPAAAAAKAGDVTATPASAGSQAASSSAVNAVTPQTPIPFRTVPAGPGGAPPPDPTGAASPPARVDAVVTTARGPAIVASTSRSPWQLAAPIIERVVVHGPCVVSGAHWLNARALDPGAGAAPWRTWSLPVTSGARYGALPAATADARARVERGAPQRVSLIDDPTIADPWSAPALATATAIEYGRVKTLVSTPAAGTPVPPNLQQTLQRLIDDTSAAQLDLSQSYSLDGLRQPGQVTLPLYGSVMQASMDPGLARWLGFADVDDAPPTATPGELVAYFVRAIFAYDDGALKQLAPTIPPTAPFNAADFSTRVPDAPPDAATRFKSGKFIELWAIAIAVVGAPPDPPPPPIFDPPVVGRWMPLPPPRAERRIELPARGLVPAARLSLARLDAGGPVSLNPPSLIARNNPAPGTAGINQPLVASVPPSATSTGTGLFSDRSAPESEVRYRGAQSDLHGRWSFWSEIGAPSGARPLPPAPAIELGYTPPAPADWPADGSPQLGALSVDAVVPDNDHLAPGSRRLKTLRVQVVPAPGLPPVIASADVSAAVPVAAAAPPTDASPSGTPAVMRLSVPVADPSLRIGRALTRAIVVTAWWVDEAGVFSLSPAPLRATLRDPRPPRAPVIDPAFRYSARPDVEGVARVSLDWDRAADQDHFRVYYSDENLILRGLENAAAAADLAGRAADAADFRSVRAQLADAAAPADGSAPDPIARAELYQRYADRFGPRMFENLTADPLAPSTPGTTPPVRVTFQHALSGSLQVLSLYRVIAVNAAHVGADFNTAPLLVVAVPRVTPPATPMLSVQAQVTNDPRPLRALLTVKIPRGATTPARYRVRRAVTPQSDPLRMPVAFEGSIPAAPGDPIPAQNFVTDAETTSFTLADDGRLEFAVDHALLPWMHYTWTVEVQGELPATTRGGPAGLGEWSRPSAKATAAHRAAPPSRLMDLSGTRPGPSLPVTLTWRPSESLAGGSVGEYRCDVYRQEPNQPPSLYATVPPYRDPGAPITFTESTASPDGSAFFVVVVDPLGRSSAPSPRVVPEP